MIRQIRTIINSRLGLGIAIPCKTGSYSSSISYLSRFVRHNYLVAIFLQQMNMWMSKYILRTDAKWLHEVCCHITLIVQHLLQTPSDSLINQTWKQILKSNKRHSCCGETALDGVYCSWNRMAEGRWNQNKKAVSATDRYTGFWPAR